MWKPVDRRENRRGYVSRVSEDGRQVPVTIKPVSCRELRLRKGAQFFEGDTDASNPLGKLWLAIRKSRCRRKKKGVSDVENALARN